MHFAPITTTEIAIAVTLEIILLPNVSYGTTNQSYTQKSRERQSWSLGLGLWSICKVNVRLFVWVFMYFYGNGMDLSVRYQINTVGHRCMPSICVLWPWWCIYLDVAVFSNENSGLTLETALEKRGGVHRSTPLNSIPCWCYGTSELQPWEPTSYNRITIWMEISNANKRNAVAGSAK